MHAETGLESAVALDFEHPEQIEDTTVGWKRGGLDDSVALISRACIELFAYSRWPLFGVKALRFCAGLGCVYGRRRFVGAHEESECGVGAWTGDFVIDSGDAGVSGCGEGVARGR